MLDGKSRAALYSLVAALFASACATPYDPFRIPATELRERVRTIALAPLQVNVGAADRALAREQIEPLVAARLAAGGFQVVASAEMERIWRAATADVGDVFDPVTGKVDQERYDLVEASVYHELRAEHEADAVLWMRVGTVELYRTRSNITYCGTNDALYWPVGKFSVLETATRVVASCLSATLYDMEERELYSIRNGLEPIETFARQTLAVRPADERLQDPGRLQHAVDATVGPLADRVAGR